MKNIFFGMLAVLMAFSIFSNPVSATWCDSNYQYRIPTNITVNSPLATGYTINSMIATNGGHFLAAGNDTRIFIDNGAFCTEIDRNITQQNTANTLIENSITSAIAGGTSNTSYYIYYGYSAAGNPPNNRSNVYYFFDDFNSAAISSAWTQYAPTGSISQTGGNMQFTCNGGTSCNWWSSVDEGPKLNITAPSSFQMDVTLNSYTTGSANYAGLWVGNGYTNFNQFGRLRRDDLPMNAFAVEGPQCSGSYTYSSTGLPAKLRIISNSTKTDYYVDSGSGFNEIVETCTQQNKYIGLFLKTWLGLPATTTTFDNFVVKLWVSSPPTITFGEEETQNNIIENNLIFTGNKTNSFTIPTGESFSTNITVQNATSNSTVGNVWIEFNGTNYSAVQVGSCSGVGCSGGIFNWNTTLSVGMGTYTIKQFASETVTGSNKTNSSTYFDIKVPKTMILNILSPENTTYLSGNINLRYSYQNIDVGESNFTNITFETNFDNPYTTYVCDIDKNGKNDIVSVGQRSNRVSWWNNTDGTGNAFSAENIINSSLSAPDFIWCDDVNGDGYPDVQAVEYNGGKVDWFENPYKNGGTVWKRHILATNMNGAIWVSTEDLYKTNKTGIFAAQQLGGDVRYYRNDDGYGNFTEIILSSNISGAHSVIPFDMNNDGYNDVLVTGENGNKIAILKNNGDNTFTEIDIDLVTSGPNYASPADFNKDGFIDFAAAQWGAGKLDLYMATDNYFHFTKTTLNSTFNSAHGVISEDIDGDGNADIVGVCGSHGSCDSLALWKGYGNGSFTPQKTLMIADTFWGLSVGYINNNNLKDIAAGAAEQKWVAWFNQINSQFRYSIDGGANISLAGNTTITVSSGTHKLTVYATDIEDNQISSTVFFTIQPQPPRWSSVSSSPNSPQNYNSSGSYGFQISSSDDNMLSTKFQIGRPNGIITNYTANNNSASGKDIWYYNITQLSFGGTGTYNYTWYLTDSENLQNKSDDNYYTISHEYGCY